MTNKWNYKIWDLIEPVIQKETEAWTKDAKELLFRYLVECLKELLTP